MPSALLQVHTHPLHTYIVALPGCFQISDSPLASLGYSPDVISGIIKSISEDNASEAEQVHMRAHT